MDGDRHQQYYLCLIVRRSPSHSSPEKVTFIGSEYIKQMGYDYEDASLVRGAFLLLYFVFSHFTTSRCTFFSLATVRVSKVIKKTGAVEIPESLIINRLNRH